MKRLSVTFLVIAMLLSFSLLTPALAPRDALPPLPDSIPSALGWVDVHRVPGLLCGGQPAYGCYNPETRTLEVRDSIHLAVAWQTLRHEELHMIAADAGIAINMTAQDLLADAVGAARVREMLVK